MALESVDPYKATKALVRFISSSTLRIGDLRYDLRQISHIYVLGAGKATLPIAMALEEVLDDRISDGCVNVKRGQGGRLRRIRVIQAGHPLPDEDGLKGAQQILEIASRAKRDDLVICCFTGGSSATCPLPPEGVSLDDKRRLTALLLASGANIREINAVRKHVSRVKGGRLATKIAPAEVVNLTVSDVVGDPLDCITDLTVPDTSTVGQAIGVLRKYRLWNAVPESVRQHLSQGDETPKDLGGVRINTFVLATNRDMCVAARRTARELGYNSRVLSSMIEGEAREVGTVLASIAKSAERWKEPVRPPAVLVAGGETTVRLAESCGQGGRNQELALSFSLGIDGHDGIVGAFVASDGTDGPTDIAGGLVDGSTVQRARDRSVDIETELGRHNSSEALLAVGDAIVTGPTGTNVMDLHLLFVSEDSATSS